MGRKGMGRKGTGLDGIGRDMAWDMAWDGKGIMGRELWGGNDGMGIG
jgi:hypothetical protein